MRVLVTGSAGFIGSHLCERFTRDGHHVVGVDNFTTGRRDNWPDTRACDIVDRHTLYGIANELGPELVVHCAASYSDPNLWHRDTDTNIAGTINAVAVAREHGARLVYFQTALPPISSYAITKIAGEQYITLSGVDHLIFRLANIYGPRNLSGPIPTFYKRLTNGQACTVTDTRRDMVFIDDLVRGVTRAISEEASGKFDMASGVDRPIAELYQEVANTLGIGGPPKRVPAPDDDVKQMELNPHRTLVRLGWYPRTPLNYGVQLAVAWYREHGVTDTYTHLRIAS